MTTRHQLMKEDHSTPRLQDGGSHYRQRPTLLYPRKPFSLTILVGVAFICAISFLLRKHGIATI